MQAPWQTPVYGQGYSGYEGGMGGGGGGVMTPGSGAVYLSAARWPHPTPQQPLPTLQHAQMQHVAAQWQVEWQGQHHWGP